MTSHGTLRSKTYALLVPVILFGPAGNALLGKGMKQIGAVRDYSPAALASLLLRIFTSPWIWLGIACLLTFLVSYMVLLSWADYSFVMPVTAITYAITAFIGNWLLGETVTPQRWLGIALICLGVACVTQTPSSTTVRD